MPIRMEEDDPQDEGRRRRDPDPDQGGGGGGGNIMAWLPLVLMFLFKKPKLLIPLLVIGGIVYFMFFSGGGGGEYSEEEESGYVNEDSPVDFQLGASLSPERFDKAQVFEPLASGNEGMNRIPRRVSLQQYAPKRMQQGRQGSCVGWASAYAARTILEARSTGRDPNAVAFSPAYLYNQIHLDDCQGAYMIEAMKAMKQNGGLPFKQFGYDESSCDNYPDRNDVNQGQQFRIKGYNRLTLSDSDQRPDIDGIRQHLAQGAPVVIGAMVGGSFMNNMLGRKVWQPTQRDYNMGGFGGHAMCVIGYDDDYVDGSFQIMNSWGEEWGDRGMCWVRYEDFEFFVKEAYGLYPMGASNDTKVDPGKLAVEFGLLDNASKQVIPIKQASDIVFRTTQPLSKGQKFKALIANSIECYVYILGQETDGSSYVLFPYTEKHDPYCGIVGTRLFPRDYSMTPDQVGNRDYIGIVVSKAQLDFKKLNAAVNQAPGATYADKLKAALGNQRMRTASFKPGKNTIAFEANVKEDANVVGAVIEIEKR
jgi:Papain family cysteine protease